MDSPGFKLFTPLALGEGLTLKNRIVLSPMTRGRSDTITRAPTEINEIYYEQRAGAGLIITEGAGISEQGHGWYGAPALYNDKQAAGWKKVVDRVHAKNGKIFLQLWHMARQGHSSFNSKNEIVAPSAIRMPENFLTNNLTKNSKGEAVPYEVPRALETDEIASVVDDYRKSAALAKSVGFDGVELHGANGYLVDLFLQSVSNKRTDEYGGSFENRARFLLEVVDALKTVFPADRIGVRLSPNGGFGGMGSPDNAELFTYVFEKLSDRGLAYVATLDGYGFGRQHSGRLLNAFDVKKHFKGTVLAGCSYTRDIAEGAVRTGAADLVAFGRPYIGTPDLAERFEQDVPLNPDAPYEVYWDPSKGPAGYIDFPFHEA